MATRSAAAALPISFFIMNLSAASAPVTMCCPSRTSPKPPLPRNFIIRYPPMHGWDTPFSSGGGLNFPPVDRNRIPSSSITDTSSTSTPFTLKMRFAGLSDMPSRWLAACKKSACDQCGCKYKSAVDRGGQVGPGAWGGWVGGWGGG